MINEAVVWRAIRTLTMTLLIALVVVVAVEWTSRQWLDQNVWLAWLEMAGVLGFVCTSCAIPFVVPRRIRPHTQDDSRLTGPRAFIIIGSCIFAIHLCLYSLNAEIGQGRLYFLSYLTLSMLSAVIALSALALVARGVSLQSLRSSASVHIARNSGQRVTVSFTAIIVAASFAVIFRPDGEHGYLLLGQIAWNLLSQDDFLAVLLFSCLIEPIGRIDGGYGCTEKQYGFMNAVQSGLQSDGPNVAAPWSMSETAWVLIGRVMPLSRLVLLTALFIGLRGAEAMASILIPGSLLVIGAALISIVARVGCGSTPNPNQDVAPKFAPRDGNSILGVAGALVLVPTAAIVLLGYARPVEAVALAGAAFIALVLMKNDRRVVLRGVTATLPRHIGEMGLYVISGGFLYLTSGVVGFQTLVAQIIEVSGLSLIPVIAILVFTAILLSRWLAPLELLIVLLPVAPIALQSTGASLQQTFAIICILVAIAPNGYRFVTAKICANELSLFGLLSFVLLLLFSVAVFPELVEAVPAGRRFW